MRSVPERSPGLQVVTVFGGFLVGPLVGLRMSMALAPESDLVQTATVFGFAMVFVGGMVLWMGFGVAAVVVSAVSRLLRGKSPRPNSAGSGLRLVPPGYRSFVLLAAIAGIGLGLLAGLVTGLAVSIAVVVWTAVALAYGFLLWAAAHSGYLPFLEPE